jgi:hypothetical protein
MSSEEPLRNPFIVHIADSTMDRKHVNGAADKAKGVIKEGPGHSRTFSLSLRARS